MSDWTKRNRAFSNALTDAQTAYIDAEIAARELQDENTKLRELCKDMWGWILAPTAGGEGLHEIADRVRELEIEVES